MITVSELCVAEICKLQMAVTGNCSSLSQVALHASLQYIMSEPESLDKVTDYYYKRTKLVVHSLNAIGQRHFNGFTIAIQPEATFYVVGDFSCLPSSIVKNDIDLQQYFRDMYKYGTTNTGVALVPGSAFGIDTKLKYLRFSCAAEIDDIEKAMEVIEEAIIKILQAHHHNSSSSSIAGVIV